MSTQDVISEINRTKKLVGNLDILPSKQGIYAFSLSEGAELGLFGLEGRVIYVGIAEKSLSGRDSRSHLKTGQTGFSSLRRSLGAILKNELLLSVIPRDINGKKLRPDKYKFDPDGELKLTEWMMKT